MKSTSLIIAMAIVALLGLVGARRQQRVGFLPTQSSPAFSSFLSARSPLQLISAAVPQVSSLKPAVLVRSKSVAVFQQPPERRTRKNEPNEYFKSEFEKKPATERFVDPQVIIALVGILLPFIAVGILFSGGFLTR